MPSILICGSQIRSGYSGGRYHALIAGISLAEIGWEVIFWTNCIPGFLSDFKGYEAVQQITWHIDVLPYARPPARRCDCVLIVPDRSGQVSCYINWIRYAFNHKSSIILLNFESPNWFNAYSPTHLPERLWEGWNLTASVSSVILSSAAISNSYAYVYYKKTLSSTIFSFAYPAINSKIADSLINSETHISYRSKRICLITRFGGTSHKGAEELLNIMNDHMNGAIFLIIADPAKAEQRLLQQIEERAKDCGIELVFRTAIDDKEKFYIIRSSAALVFLSRFEGFGYPPVEALYMGTPCITYDLPVIRESCGSFPDYVKVGDTKGVQCLICHYLSVSSPSKSVAQHKREKYTVTAYGLALQNILLSSLSEKRSLLEELKYNLTVSMIIPFKKYIISILTSMIKLREKLYFRYRSR